MGNHHVVKGSDGWKVKGENKKRASFCVSTKDEAIKHAKAITKNNCGTVIIHGADGKIQRHLKPVSREEYCRVHNKTVKDYSRTLEILKDR